MGEGRGGDRQTEKTGQKGSRSHDPPFPEPGLSEPGHQSGRQPGSVRLSLVALGHSPWAWAAPLGPHLGPWARSVALFRKTAPCVRSTVKHETTTTNTYPRTDGDGLHPRRRHPSVLLTSISTAYEASPSYDINKDTKAVLFDHYLPRGSSSSSSSIGSARARRHRRHALLACLHHGPRSAHASHAHTQVSVHRAADQKAWCGCPRPPQASLMRPGPRRTEVQINLPTPKHTSGLCARRSWLTEIAKYRSIRRCLMPLNFGLPAQLRGGEGRALLPCACWVGVGERKWVAWVARP